MERPLETIKSFEIAIDRAFAQRQASYYRTISTRILDFAYADITR
jgi:hypothetical protein